jgi:beta-glucanase (GH16 family)
MKTHIPTIEEGFHVYAIEWDAKQIAFSVDNQQIYVYQPAIQNENNWPFAQPFYVIVNMAIGGKFGGPEVDDSIFPQQFALDYIKVYQ